MPEMRSNRIDTSDLFPLAKFLSSLSDVGLRVTLDDYRRISLALRAGGPWTRAQLRGVLATLLVRDRDQVAPFRQRFDAFFALAEEQEVRITPGDLEQALAELRELGALPRTQSGDNPPWPRVHSKTVRAKPFQGWALPRPWGWSVLAAVLFAGLFLLREGIPPGPPKAAPSTARKPEPAEAPALPQQSPAASSPVAASRPRVRTYPQAPVLRFKEFHPWPQPPAWADPRLLAVAALGYGFWVWRWARSGGRVPVPVDAGQGSGPRLFRLGAVGGGPAPRLDRQTLDRIADSLGYFRSEETGQDLDLRASVQRTAESGGIPTPVFALRRRVRSVLILEDFLAPAREWNPIARELSEGLSQRGVSVLHGHFLGVPDRFRSADGFDRHIEDLEDERRGYLALIFSDAKGLGSPEATFVLERLARWPQVAWMQLRERRAWDRTERRPALQGLPVFPADPQGLLEAVSAFTTERAARRSGPEPESWRGLPTLPASTSGEVVYEEILGDSLLWAQACAMAPPPISLGLADRLRERFHPELPPPRIERLLALPGSLLMAGSLKLADRALAVLRDGFAKRRSREEQEAVLRFLLERLQEAEPADRESLEHQAWEWRLERTRLELDPERAAERLLALAQGPLREAIRTDLAKRWSSRDAARSLAPRAHSMSRYTAERLTALVEGREFSLEQLYRPRLWPEAGLVTAAVALLAVCLWRASFTAAEGVNVAFAGEELGPGKLRVMSEGEILSFQTPPANEISYPRPPGQVRLSMFLAGKGLVTTRLNASRPGTYVLEIGIQTMTLPCEEEILELGLIVTRCSLYLPRKYSQLTEKQGDWIARLGLVFLDDDHRSNIGDYLLASGGVDVLYMVRVPANDLTNHAKSTVRWLRDRWAPWADEVRLVTWYEKEETAARMNDGELLSFMGQVLGHKDDPRLADWDVNHIVELPRRHTSLLAVAWAILEFEGSPQRPVQVPAEVTKPGPGAQTGSPNVAQEAAAPAVDQPAVAHVDQSVEDAADRDSSPAAVEDTQPTGDPSCSNPALTRCGGLCVDVTTNPFHHGSCFQIAFSLSRQAAESVDSPPPWSDESIQPRRYYRLYYVWNDKTDAVIVRNLPSRSGWDRGDALVPIALTLRAGEIAKAGYTLAVTDLEVHCVGQAWVAGFSSTEREMYEKLSRLPTWRAFPKRPWRGPGEISTDTGLVQTLGPVLSHWEELCVRQR